MRKYAVLYDDRIGNYSVIFQDEDDGDGWYVLGGNLDKYAAETIVEGMNR